MYNWMKRHLNISLVIGVMLIESPFMGCLWNIGSYTLNQVLVILVPTILIEWAYECWYLNQKKRNFAYLLYNLIKIYYIPLGLFLMLALENRRTKKGVEEIIA